MHLVRTNSNDPSFVQLVRALDEDLTSRYEERQAVYDQFNKVPDLPTVIVAYESEVPAGCGAFKRFDEHSVEIKRMFVDTSYRGRGIAASIVQALENWAKENGYTRTVLETGNKQHEAIGLYKKLGYRIIANYGPYVGMETSICMEKLI